jgi:hypothetical protein
MSVDYRLLEHFQASWERFEAARRALPEPWRQDARPDVQSANERWVTAVARAREHIDSIDSGSSSRSRIMPIEDR